MVDIIGTNYPFSLIEISGITVKMSIYASKLLEASVTWPNFGSLGGSLLTIAIILIIMSRHALVAQLVRASDC